MLQGESSDPRELAARLERDFRRDEVEMLGLLAGADGEFVFAFILHWVYSTLRTGHPAEHETLSTFLEYAAFHAYTRFGQGGSRDPGVAEEILTRLQTLHARRPMLTVRLGDPPPTAMDASAQHARHHSAHVRDTGYHTQTREKIEGLLGPLDAELAALAGIGPRRALAILDTFAATVTGQLDAAGERVRSAERHLCTVGERQPNGSYRRGPDAEAFVAGCRAFQAAIDEAPFAVLVSLATAQSVAPGLSEAEWEALARLCGMTADARRAMCSPEEVKARPLYFFPDRTFTIFNINATYDALFAAFDQTARSDATLRGAYGLAVANWMEGEAERFLLRLFPRENVYRTLDYPNPDPVGGTAELDLAVTWGPFLMLVEAKGRQFRRESQKGDAVRLRADMRVNIAEGFWQARRVIRYLSSMETGRLVERRPGGRVLEVRWNRVKRCFPVVITLEHFAGLATQLANTAEPRWFGQATYPWAVSLADFDIITRFAGSPDVLLHYAQRRIQLQESGRNIEGDELDIFGLYLDSRLHPSQFWERSGEHSDFDRMTLSGGSSRFDDWMRAQDDPSLTAPEIQLMLPPRFEAIIRVMRSHTDDDSRAITMSLLDLSTDAITRLEASIQRLLTTEVPAGTFPRITAVDHDVVVVAMANRGLAPAVFRSTLIERTAREKYRARASRAVGLAFDAGRGPADFAGAIWLEYPWTVDPEGDRRLAAEDTRRAQRGAQ